MTHVPTRSALILPALLVAGAAVAQDGLTHIEQQPSAVQPAAAQVGVAQITDRSAELTPVQPSPEPVRPLPQVGDPDQSARPAAQITAERGGVAAGPQLSEGGTAEGPPALSRPAEGRTGAVARVEGEDRCAPDAAGKRPAVCARVIETRSAEFARPDPLALSPEQRLLVEQRLREGTTGSAVRLAATRPAEAAAAAADPEQPESQAIASVVLDRPEREDSAQATLDAAGALPEASAALIEALLNNAGAAAPPR